MYADGYVVDALVTDFDSTLTTGNTTPGVLDLIYDHATEPDRAREEVGALCGAYFDERRTAIEGAGGMDDLLARMGRVEEKYNPLIATYFSGITRDEMAALGRTTELRKEASGAIGLMSKAGMYVAVDTNNWSRALVEGALEGTVPHDVLYSNALVYDEGAACVGEMVFENMDPQAKLDALLRYKEETGAERIAYVGDDLNDIACMATADVAFAIKPSNDLLVALERYGLSDHVTVVDSWDEIDAALRTDPA